MTDTLPDLLRDQEVQEVPGKMNQRGLTSGDTHGLSTVRRPDAVLMWP